MVGRPVDLNPDRAPHSIGAPILVIEDLNILDHAGRPIVSNINFEVRAGEVLAVAGVQGNGQSELARAIDLENQRQEDHIELIASENYASPRVLAAQGSVLTNKYAEGYPGKRYYGGCEHVDVAESLARERLKTLFGADHANVQPHSGASANMAVYLGLLKPGDTILGLSLDHGGHLTHGSPVNASGLLYRFVPYKVTPGDERVDMDQVRELALQHRPKMIVAGTTSYPRRLDPAAFRAIADEVGALMMFDIAHIAGLVAGGAHPNPVPYADVVTFTTHKTLRGPRGGCILSTAAHAAARATTAAGRQAGRRRLGQRRTPQATGLGGK